MAARVLGAFSALIALRAGVAPLEMLTAALIDAARNAGHRCAAMVAGALTGEGMAGSAELGDEVLRAGPVEALSVFAALLAPAALVAAVVLTTLAADRWGPLTAAAAGALAAGSFAVAPVAQALTFAAVLVALAIIGRLCDKSVVGAAGSFLACAIGYQLTLDALSPDGSVRAAAWQLDQLTGSGGAVGLWYLVTLIALVVPVGIAVLRLARPAK